MKYKVNQRELRYGGRAMVAGDEFDAPENDKDIKILFKLGRIQAAPPAVPRRGRPPGVIKVEAPEPQSSPEPVSLVAESVGIAEANIQTTGATGEYERRDMRAKK